MNDNSQTALRALQADEIDQVSGGMLAHLAVWLVVTVATMGLAVSEQYRAENGPITEPTSGVRRGST